MKLTHIDNMKFEDDPDLPHELFKYRDWDDKWHKKVLTNRELYLAPPSSFEDIMDCKLQKRYDLMTEQDMYKLYLKTSKREHPERSRGEHRKYASDWTKKSPLKDKKYIKEQQEIHYTKFDKRLGVLSLTAYPDNLDMWNKYANNGNGFCVGFDSIKLFEHVGGGGKVHYVEELPIIYYDDDNTTEQIKQIFFKETKWSFEKEYRTHKFNSTPMSTNDRTIVIPTEAFKTVSFGWNMMDNQKEEIVNICNEQDFHVKFVTQTRIKNH